MKSSKKFYVVCSLAIGDGHIRKRRKTKKAELDIAHHIKHKDYIEYKRNILENLGIDTSIYYKKHKPNIQLSVHTKSNYLCYCVWKKLYDNKQKVFTNAMMRNFDEWSLAILWMDDGWVSYQKKKLKNGMIYRYKFGGISTNKFDRNNNRKVLKWLSKFGIIGYLVKDNRLSEDKKYAIRFDRDNVNKLIEVVRPIVEQIPSMQHKIKD